MSIIYYLLSFCIACCTINATTIILDPAGDAKQTGRTIDDTFERAITLSCAQALKEELESSFPHCSVLLSRHAGQEITPLHIATFSNRLAPALHINIQAYAQPRDTKPTMTLYQLSLGDDFVTKSHDLAFIPFDEAHRAHHEQSATYAHTVFSQLSTYDHTAAFCTKGPYALPIAPLLGIQAPAFSCELGLINAHDWKLFVKPLAASIAACLHFS